MGETNTRYDSCPLCGSNALKNLYGQNHFLVKCRNCSLTFSGIKPSDAELKKYYYDYPSYEALPALTLRRYNEILDKLEAYRKTNNLLETGCGYGFFLEEAKKRNWNVCGTELSVKAIENCRKRDIFVAETLEEVAEHAKDKFDVIVSLEVIEHLSNPTKEVAVYSQIIREGGAVYFTTPNFNSFSRRLLKDKWNVIIYPEHLFYFTPRTINRLMEENAFKLETIQTSGFSPARLIFTMRSRNTTDPEILNYDYNEKDRQVRDSIEKNLLLRAAKSTINFFLSLFDAGDTLKTLYSRTAVERMKTPVNGKPASAEGIQIMQRQKAKKISVTIPSYNQGNYLEETILSVIEQNYPNLELFVMDGGSTDNSREIIRKYEKNLTAWVSEKDSGQSEAINKGFNKSTGEIVSWLCSDDLYTKDSLQKVNDIFSSLPDSVGVVHGNSEIFKGSQTVRYDRGYQQWSIERQLAGMAFPQPSSFIRRSALEQAGFCNQAFHYGMDYDLFSRLTMVCDFHYIDTFFSRYRLHGESKSTIAEAKFIEEWIIIFNGIVDGLNLVELKDILRKLQLKVDSSSRIIEFYKSLSSPKTFDTEKLLFFFLMNVIRYDYASWNFDRVRKVGGYIKEKFPNNLTFEPDISRILKRAAAPTFLIQIARKLKRSLSNG